RLRFSGRLPPDAGHGRGFAGRLRGRHGHGYCATYGRCCLCVCRAHRLATGRARAAGRRRDGGAVRHRYPAHAVDRRPIASGYGAQSSWAGYTLVPATTNTRTSFAFRITGPGGATITTFEPDQTKLMHFYLIRADLSGYQHIHPTMAADGTWTAGLATPAPGS